MTIRSIEPEHDVRAGQSTWGATHLIKVAVEAAAGKRAYVEVYGSDYDTPDGTGVRDYIHVSDLAAAHVHAVERLIAAPAIRPPWWPTTRLFSPPCNGGRGATTSTRSSPTRWPGSAGSPSAAEHPARFCQSRRPD